MTTNAWPVRFAGLVVGLALQSAALIADPVVSSHPRLLLTTSEKARLLAKKNASDPSWLALKARADTLATYTVQQYKFATSSSAPPNTIYYTYQGEGWLYATMPLALAYQMTNDTVYSNKLIELAQEMIRAQSDPDNNPPSGLPPIRLDSYYASRAVAPTLAFIYDYCYDQLSPSLKTQIVALMNDYYDDLAVNGYQAQDFSYAADGNYFGGHLFAVALMGYASYGDNPRAQEMIEWARIRFDGSAAPAIPPARIPQNWRSQCFEGGMRPAVAMDFNGPAITGAPFKGGFDFQAWSYGAEEFTRMIEYMLVVKSATGEDLVTPRIDWFSQILRALKHALFPNRFMIDPTGDWGGYQGAVISRGLPVELAFVLAGTADGPGAQNFVDSGIAAPTISGIEVYPAPEWVEFYFGASRPSVELTLPPYYTAFAPNYPQAAHAPGGTNGAIPYFIMRSDWTSSATWASIVMGSQWWDDHQHFTAGHMIIARGSDYLLVSANDWKTELDGSGNPIYGSSGVLGGSLQLRQSSLNNTLYFDDYGEFQGTDELASGGQLSVGIDEVVANELNQDFSYVRSDLSTAYNRAGDPDDAQNRKLEHFYRSFLYLRSMNVFVVYDQVKAKTSSNPRGPYRKHIRWHLPNNPTITGKTARLDYGQSRIYIDTVLPATASLNVVNVWSNPDPCEVGEGGCVPFGTMQSGTFRVEVRDPQNPLTIPFLTVLQPGANTMQAPTNTQIATLDAKMIGVDISQAGGSRGIALFNDQAGQVPAPVTSTSYNFSAAGIVSHTLMGLVPNGIYQLGLAGGVMTVAQNANGNRIASPSGILHFTTSGTTLPPSPPAGVEATAATAAQVNVTWLASPGATSYAVDRRATGGGFTQIATPSVTSFSDTSVTAGNAYLYRVRALNAAGPSNDSTAALATTVFNDPMTAGTPVLASHLTQLRTAITAVRTLASLGAPAVTNASPTGVTIKAVHVTELRSALDAALTALGLTVAGYTNASLSSAPVKAIDFQELRDRIQ